MVAHYNKYLLNEQILLRWERTSVVFKNIQIGKRKMFRNKHTKRLAMFYLQGRVVGGGKGGRFKSDFHIVTKRLAIKGSHHRKETVTR